MSETRLEHMRVEHVEQVVAIDRETNLAPWTDTMFRLYLSSSRYDTRVILEGDTVVGFSVLLRTDPARALNLRVAKAHQGWGYGRLLAETMVEYARDICDGATLEVAASNVAAQALYKSVGCRVIGTRPRYFPTDDGYEDGVVMRLDFEPRLEP